MNFETLNQVSLDHYFDPRNSQTQQQTRLPHDP
jgi:hypothetical protein